MTMAIRLLARIPRWARQTRTRSTKASIQFSRPSRETIRVSETHQDRQRPWSVWTGQRLLAGFFSFPSHRLSVSALGGSLVHGLTRDGRPGFGRMANGIRRLSLVRIMYARIQKLKVTSVYPENMSLACIGCLFIEFSYLSFKTRLASAKLEL